MALTNFSNGVSSFGVPIFGGGNIYTGLSFPTGNVWFVSSTTGANGGTGTSPQYAFATLAYALTQAVATNGDVIVLLPNHAETISSATALTLSKAGITILGQGSRNSRPTFTLDTANTATINVTAANVVIDNCIFIANFLSIAACFTLTTAKGFQLTNCVFKETSSVLNFLNIVKSTGAANTVDSICISDNRWYGLGTTSVSAFLISAAAIDGAIINNNFIRLAHANDIPALATITGILTNLWCEANRTSTQQTATTTGSLIGLTAANSTGFVCENRVATLTTTSDLLVTAGSKMGFANNLVSGVADKSGFLIPTADS